MIAETAVLTPVDGTDELEFAPLPFRARLLSLQTELKAPKGQYNSFGKYNFRSCEDILEAVKPLLMKYGIGLKLTDEVVTIGSRYYVKATARAVDVMLQDGEIVESTAYAREDEDKKGMDGSQITGTASSYARKYALNGLFLIDDTKDSDATNDHGKGETGRNAQAAQNGPQSQPQQAAEVSEDEYRTMQNTFKLAVRAQGRKATALLADVEAQVGGKLEPYMPKARWEAAMAALSSLAVPDGNEG